MVIQFVCLWIFILWLIVVITKKNFIHVITFITWGVYFPLFLYTLNWSSMTNKQNSGIFNYIFISLAVIVTIYTFSTYKIKIAKNDSKDVICVTRFGNKIAPYINWIFVFFYLLENLLGSGSIIPGLIGKDIHTFSFPIISYITTCSFVFIAFDYYYWKATKKKRYFLWIIVILLIPIVTRSSRMMSVITIIQILVLLFCVETITFSTKEDKKKFYIKVLVIVSILLVAAIALILFTNYRMSGYGKYDITYEKQTGYIGPKWLVWASPYYGYFPMSFNNLKINILFNQNVKHNYIGLYSFASFFFGLLQFDNLFGISTTGCFKGQLKTDGAMSVSTGFWEYYYDYGYLYFVPIIVALVITYVFLKMCNKNTNKLGFRTLYAWYVSLWFFISFQNTLYMSTSIVLAICLFFIIQKSFFVKKENFIVCDSVVFFETFGIPGSGKSFYCLRYKKRNCQINFATSLEEQKSGFWGKVKIKILFLFARIKNWRVYKQLRLILKDKKNIFDRNAKTNTMIDHLCYNISTYLLENEGVYYILDEGVIHCLSAIGAEYDVPLESLIEVFNLIDKKVSFGQIYYLEVSVEEALKRIKERDRHNCYMDEFDEETLKVFLLKYQEYLDGFYSLLKDRCVKVNQDGIAEQSEI